MPRRRLLLLTGSFVAWIQQFTLLPGESVTTTGMKQAQSPPDSDAVVHLSQAPRPLNPTPSKVLICQDAAGLEVR